MALPDALLGSALKAYFDSGYTAGTGTFVDAKGNATSFTEATSGFRPSWDTTTAPSGRGVLSFPGTGSYRLEGGNIPTGVLAAYAGSGFWVDFCIVKRNSSSGAIDDERIIDYDGSDSLQVNYGKIYRLSSYSDAVRNTNYMRVIIVTNAATNLVTQYIDNVAQADTGATDGTAFGIRAQWVGPKYIGNRNNRSTPYGGLVGCIGWAQQSTWTSGDTAALDAAMVEWWTTAPGGGGGPVTLAATSNGAASTAVSVSVARRLTASSPGAATTAAALRRARPFAAVAAGVATTTGSLAVARRLQTSIAGAASTSAATRVSRRLAATSNGAASTALSVRASRRLAATSNGSASTALALRANRGLAATSGGVATAAVQVRVARALGGTAAGVGSTSVALSVGGVREVFFAATATAASTTTAQMVVARRFGGAAAGQANTSASIVRVRFLAATSQGAASTSTHLSATRRFVMTSAGFATTAASLALDSEPPLESPTIVVVASAYHRRFKSLWHELLRRRR